MVSIMRTEQTLRLIQLYHEHYPEIAQNNQDAEGRNQKMYMWAKITEQLNNLFDTLFTVEQFKKKVQNVQCTSRQKLYSGKRNLGEAEVEYLRLFEADKISEDALLQRSKSRTLAAEASSTGKLPQSALVLSQLAHYSDDGCIILSSRAISEDLDTPVSIGPCSSEHTHSSVKELEEDEREETVRTASANEYSLEAKNNISDLPVDNSYVVSTSHQNQLDSTHQFLLAILNATFGGLGKTEEMPCKIEASEMRKKRKFSHLNIEKGGEKELEEDGRKKKEYGKIEVEEGDKIVLCSSKKGYNVAKRSRKSDRPARGYFEHQDALTLMAKTFQNEPTKMTQQLKTGEETNRNEVGKHKHQPKQRLRSFGSPSPSIDHSNNKELPLRSIYTQMEHEEEEVHEDGERGAFLTCRPSTTIINANGCSCNQRCGGVSMKQLLGLFEKTNATLDKIADLIEERLPTKKNTNGA